MLTHRHLDFAGQHIYELFAFMVITNAFVILLRFNRYAESFQMLILSARC